MAQTSNTAAPLASWVAPTRTLGPPPMTMATTIPNLSVDWWAVLELGLGMAIIHKGKHQRGQQTELEGGTRYQNNIQATSVSPMRI